MTFENREAAPVVLQSTIDCYGNYEIEISARSSYSGGNLDESRNFVTQLVEVSGFKTFYVSTFNTLLKLFERRR